MKHWGKKGPRCIESMIPQKQRLNDCIMRRGSWKPSDNDSPY